MRPIIGVTSDYHALDPGRAARRGEATYFLRARYVNAIRDLGGIPFILPITDDPRLIDEILARIDGLMITGSGPDLDPRLYGERQKGRFKKMSSLRARFELELAKRAVRRDRPVLGICGGLQLFNVAMGGSLIQDIQEEISDALAHQQDAAATKTSHPVKIPRGTRLYRIVKSSLIEVNSSHHQAPKRIARSLVVNAVAPDGVIEGLESPDHRFALGVQWHPEFLYRKDPASEKLFRAFLSESARRGSV